VFFDCRSSCQRRFYGALGWDRQKWIRQVLQDLRGEKFDERTTQEKGTALTMSRKESLPFRQWWKY
jgi:hypothetical protein